MKHKKGKAPSRNVDELVDNARQLAQSGAVAEAEAMYRRALAMAPSHLGVLTLLGLLLVDQEKIDEAIDILERAREISPDFPPVQLALGTAYAAAGHDELAVTAMETAIKLDSSTTLPLERLAKHHITAKRSREAIGLLRRILRRDPYHADARFLLAGLTGERTNDPHGVAPPPPALIADLFDTYAPKFDQHLVGELAYSVPASLAALIASLGVAQNRSSRVVDLGCGTGLVGVELREYASVLVGSDLSSRMIARARQRGIYDELHVEDLGATLARERDVDVITAADVFIYVGPLESTFAASATTLRAGGLLAFSIETSDTDEVVLQTSHRYSHSDVYIRRLAATHGFSVEKAESTVLRVDAGQPIRGVLYGLRR